MTGDDDRATEAQDMLEEMGRDDWPPASPPMGWPEAFALTGVIAVAVGGMLYALHIAIESAPP